MIGFRKGRGTRDQIANICWSSKKQESFRKTSISALSTIPKRLTVWITINCGKFWKRWAYRITWPASWETYMQVRKQQLELDMEQQTGSKWEKEYVKAVYCHPAYLTYMQSTSWETLGCRKHKLESRLLGEIAITSDILAWRIPGTGEPGGVPSMGSHRVGHNWSDLAAAAADMQMTPPLRQKVKN